MSKAHASIELILSALMLEVMNLRNIHMYDVVAPQVLNEGLDAAYTRAKTAAHTLIQNRIKEELEAVERAGYDDELQTYDYNRIVEALDKRIEELNNVGN